MDVDKLIAAAARRYTITPGDIEVAEWDYKTSINDVPPAEVVLSLHDDAGPLWALTAAVVVERLCRVVLMRVRSLDIAIYVQHRHPITNLGLQTDLDVEAAAAHLRDISLPDLARNLPRLQSTIAGALRVRLMRQLPVDIASARAEIEALISNVSERLWSAGWHAEAEHRIWAMLSPVYMGEFGSLSMDEVGRLIELSAIAGSWPMDRGSWVPMDLWVRMHALWASNTPAPPPVLA